MFSVLGASDRPDSEERSETGAHLPVVDGTQYIPKCTTKQKYTTFGSHKNYYNVFIYTHYVLRAST